MMLEGPESLQGRVNYANCAQFRIGHFYWGTLHPMQNLHSAGWPEFDSVSV